MELQPKTYKGSFLEMAEKILAGTLVGQEALITSSTTTPNHHTIPTPVPPIEEQQAMVASQVLLWRMGQAMAGDNVNLNSTVVLHLSESASVTKLTEKIHRETCDFKLHGPRSITCRNIPLLTKKGSMVSVKFLHKIQAVSFFHRYQGCYKSSHVNMSMSEVAEDSEEFLDISRLTLQRHFSDKTGVPSQPRNRSFLMAQVCLSTLTVESVDSGLVTDVFRLSLQAGPETVTRTVVPAQVTNRPHLLDKLGLTLCRDTGNLLLAGNYIMNTENDSPAHFFEDLVRVFMKNLKQNNPENKFDEAVLVFKDWGEVKTFVQWVKASGSENEQLVRNYVSYFGVLSRPEQKGLSDVFQDLTNSTISYNPEQCEQESLLLGSIIGENLKSSRDFFKKFLSTSCVVTEEIFSDGQSLSARMLDQCNVCIVSLEYLHNEDNFQITQLGSCVFNKTKSGKMNKKLTFSAVLPTGPILDESLSREFGIHRDQSTGELQFLHEQQKKKYPLVSEKEALLNLFTFVAANKSIGGEKVSNTVLMTYSSYTSLPVLLKAVQRAGVEEQFYQTFSGFTDLHSLVERLLPKSDLFSQGLPPLASLAEDLADIKLTGLRHPANGAASLVFNLVEHLLRLGDVDMTAISSSAVSATSLHFPESPILARQLKVDRDIAIASGKKTEITFKIEPIDGVLDLSKMLILPVSSVREDLVVLSKVAFFDKVSLVVTNNSKDNFHLNPGDLFALLILPPSPLQIPDNLPFTDDKPNTRYSSADSLLSHEFQDKYAKVTDKKGRTTTSYEEFPPTNRTVRGRTCFMDPIKRCQSGRPEEEPKIQKVIPSYNRQSFDLFAVGLECLKLSGQQSLEPVKLSLRPLYTPVQPGVRTAATVVRTAATVVLRPWDETSLPSPTFLCSICKKTYGLHHPVNCPLRWPCDPKCKNLFGPSNHRKHIRGECQSPTCWNCDSTGHNWTGCPSPYLTTSQKDLVRLGFRFVNTNGVRTFDFEDKGGQIHDTCTKKEAVKRIVDTLDRSSAVLVGYNVSTILDLLVREADKFRYGQLLRRKIRAMIDVRWLVPESRRSLGFPSIHSKVLGSVMEDSGRWQEAEAVTEGIQEMISTKVDLGSFEETTDFVSSFAVRFNQDMISAFSTGDYNPKSFMFNMETSASRRSQPKVEAKTEVPELKTPPKKPPLTTQCYTMNIIKPRMDQNPAQLCETEDKTFSVLAISIKTFMKEGRNHLLSLSLHDVLSNRMVARKAVLPPDLANLTPQDRQSWCRTCPTPSPHLTPDCPLTEECGECLGPAHLRADCVARGQGCPNCGEQSHCLGGCGQPLLGVSQREWSQLGLEVAGRGWQRSEKAEFLLKEPGGKVACQTELEVVTDLVVLLQRAPTLLVGYNITEILLDIFSCVINRPTMRVNLQNNIAGIVDLRWLVGPEAMGAPLSKIARDLLDTTVTEDPKEIAKHIAEIARKVTGVKSKNYENFAIQFTPALLLELLTKDVNPGLGRFKELLGKVEGVKTEARDGPDEEQQEPDFAYIYIGMELKDGAEIVEGIDVLLAASDGTKKRYSQMFDSRAENAEQATFFFEQLAAGLALGSQQVAVFICPESWRMFEVLYEAHTKHPLSQVFSKWINLSEASTSLCLQATPYDKNQLAKLYLREKGFELPPNRSRCEAMREVREARLGTEAKPVVLSEAEYSVVSVHLCVDWSSVSAMQVPGIRSLTYQDINKGEIVQHHQARGMLVRVAREWEELAGDRQVVFISAQRDNTLAILLASLLEIGQTNFLSSRVAGVSDFHNFLSAMGEGDFLSTLDSVDQNSGPLTLQTVGRVLVGALGTAVAYDNYLGTFAHPLHSARVNSQLLASRLKIFSGSLVSLVSQAEVIISPEDIVSVKVVVAEYGTLEPGSSVRVLASCLPSLEVDQDSLLLLGRELDCEVELLNVENGDVVIKKDTVLATAEILEESETNKNSVKEAEENELEAEEKKDETETLQENVEPEPGALPSGPKGDLLVTRLGFFRLQR